jgi:hypothetical protein
MSRRVPPPPTKFGASGIQAKPAGASPPGPGGNSPVQIRADIAPPAVSRPKPAVQAKRIGGSGAQAGPKPPPTRFTPHLPPGTVQPDSPQRSPAPSVQCQHNPRHSFNKTIQKMETLKPQWDAKQNTKSGFKTNCLVSVDLDGAIVPLGNVSNYTAHGDHAEDQAIATIDQNLDMLPPSCTVYVHLTSSPCTCTARPDPSTPPGTMLPVTGKGCAENLVAYFGVPHVDVKGVAHNLNLVILCTGLYTPQIPGQSQAGVLAASQAAVDYLAANGITVSGNERPGAAQRFAVK